MHFEVNGFTTSFYDSIATKKGAPTLIEYGKKKVVKPKIANKRNGSVG